MSKSEGVDEFEQKSEKQDDSRQVKMISERQEMVFVKNLNIARTVLKLLFSKVWWW